MHEEESGPAQRRRFAGLRELWHEVVAPRANMVLTTVIDLAVLAAMTFTNTAFNAFVLRFAPENAGDLEITIMKWMCVAATLATAAVILVKDVWSVYKHLWGRK